MLEKVHASTPCWVCEVGEGVDYWEHFSEADIWQKPYHEGTSKVHMQLSKVMPDQLKRAHP